MKIRFNHVRNGSFPIVTINGEERNIPLLVDDEMIELIYQETDKLKLEKFSTEYAFMVVTGCISLTIKRNSWE